MAEMKFKGHQSFFIRKGWLSKGIAAVRANSAILMPSNSKLAMDELGLGSNQVSALKYWLLALGLIEKASDGKSHVLTPLCELIFEKDPYIEEMGTLWALHCVLASNKEEATAWYWFFNKSHMKVFSKADVILGLQKYVLQNLEDGQGSKKASVALSSIEADVDCIVNTYISHERLGGKPVSPENVIDCPLGDLGMLDIESRQLKTFRKMPAVPSSLPALLVMFAIALMVQKSVSGKDVIEISLNELLNGCCSPGALFNLDTVVLLTKLYELEEMGCLKINRTAGSDVVRIAGENVTPISFLEKYYEMIG